MKTVTKEQFEQWYLIELKPNIEIARMLDGSVGEVCTLRKSFGIRKRYLNLGGRVLTGMKFGQWTVLDEHHIGNRWLWRCACTCGREQHIAYKSLTKGTSYRCRMCAAKTRRDTDLVPSWYWYRVPLGAKKRNLPFLVTKEYATDLFISQGGKCKLSGVEIKFAECSWDHRNNKATTASFDRIDSSKGYTIGNVQWIHKDIQFLKMAMPEERFKELCINVARVEQERLSALSQAA